MLEDADAAVTRSSGHGTGQSTQERHSPDHAERGHDRDHTGGARAHHRQQQAMDNRSERSPNRRHIRDTSPPRQDRNGRSSHGNGGSHSRLDRHDRSVGRGGGRDGDRHRSRSPDRKDRAKPMQRDHAHRDRGRSPVRGHQGWERVERTDLPEVPDVSVVYRGTVKNTARHGAYVELAGFRGRVEGMIHISNLSSRRVTDVSEICKRGDEVWVKVLSIQPPQPGQPRQRIDLSLRDVDQGTGKDLLPVHDAALHPVGASRHSFHLITLHHNTLSLCHRIDPRAPGMPVAIPTGVRYRHRASRAVWSHASGASRQGQTAQARVVGG